jgi:hypothetical protein
MGDRIAAKGELADRASSRVVTSLLGVGGVGGTIGSLIADWDPFVAAWIFVGTALATTLHLLTVELRRAIIGRPTRGSLRLLRGASVAQVVLGLVASSLLVVRDHEAVGVVVGVVVVSPASVLLVGARSWWGGRRPTKRTAPAPRRRRHRLSSALAGSVMVGALLVGVFALGQPQADDGGGGEVEVADPPIVTVPEPPIEGSATTQPGLPPSVPPEEPAETTAPTSTTGAPSTVPVREPRADPTIIECLDRGLGAPPEIARAMVEAWDREQSDRALDCMVTVAARRGDAWTQFSNGAVMIVARGKAAFTVDPEDMFLYEGYAGPDSDLVSAVEVIGPPIGRPLDVDGGTVMVVTAGSPEAYTSRFALLTLAPGARHPHLVIDEFAVEWLVRHGPCPEGIGWPRTDERAATQVFERGRLQKDRDGLVGLAAELRDGVEAHAVDVEGAPWLELLAELDCRPGVG